MAQTDRQADKGTWWSVTAFADDEIAHLSGDQFPRFVKKVYGGLEECPTSGRRHFQGAIQCHSQQRFSALKNWLKTSHLEVARSADAIQRYAMKEDTAVGEKKETTNTTPYAAMHDLLTQVASKQIQVASELMKILDLKQCKSMDEERREEFIFCTRHIIHENPAMVSSFMIPAVEKAWIRYRDVWIGRALVLQARHTEELELLEEISRQDENIIAPQDIENGSSF